MQSDSTEHIHHSEDPNLYMKRAVADIHKAMTEGGETRIDASEAYRGMQIMMGSRRHDLSPDEWRRFGHETVALPGQARLIPVVAIHPADGATVLVGDIEFVQMG